MEAPSGNFQVSPEETKQIKKKGGVGLGEGGRERRVIGSQEYYKGWLKENAKAEGILRALLVLD